MFLLLWLSACTAPDTWLGDGSLSLDEAAPPAAPVRRWDLTPVRETRNILMTPTGPLMPASDDRCVDCGLVRVIVDGAQLAFDPLPPPPRRAGTRLLRQWGTFGATGLVQVWDDGVDVIDPDSGALLWSRNIALSNPWVVLADVDGDGVDELVAEYQGAVSIVNTAGTLVRRFYASGLLPCEVDGDPGAEAIAGDGGLWDLGTGANIGRIAQPVLGKNLPADLDGDGLDEFVVFDRTEVRATERSGVVRWRRPDLSAFAATTDTRVVVDASRGVRELWLLSSPAPVRLDGLTGAELGAPQVPPAGHRPPEPVIDRPFGIRAWDSDGDGAPGMFFAQGSALVLDEGGVSRNATVGMWWGQISAGDLDGDGVRELIFGGANYYGTTWRTFDPVTDAAGPINAVPTWDGEFLKVTPIDLDGDGQDSLITGDVMWDASVPGAPVELSRGHNGTMWAVDLTGDGTDEAAVFTTRNWGVSFSNGWALGLEMIVQDVIDLDGDGILEVVVGDYVTGDVEIRDATDGSVIDVAQVGFARAGVHTLRGWRLAGGGARLVGIDDTANTLRQWRLVRGALVEDPPFPNAPAGSWVTAVAGGFAWVNLPAGGTLVLDSRFRVRQRVPVSLSSIQVMDGRAWGRDGEVWEVPLP